LKDPLVGLGHALEAVNVFPTDDDFPKASRAGGVACCILENAILHAARGMRFSGLDQNLPMVAKWKDGFARQMEWINDFVYSKVPEDLRREFQEHGDSQPVATVKQPPAKSGVPQIPRWDADAGQIWVGEILANDAPIRRNATRLRGILDELQAANWPTTLKLSNHKVVGAKNIGDAIDDLQQRQTEIDFARYLDGRGVRWKLRTKIAQTPAATPVVRPN
jgi:hypothetical protein